MSTLKYKLLFMATILLFLGCRKDEIIVSNEDIILPDTEGVSFQLLITDESNQSIANAQVLIGSDIYDTDENGIIITKTMNVEGLGMKAEISALGYETLIKMVTGVSNSINQQHVVLFKATTSVILAGNSGTIDGEGDLLLPPLLNKTDGSAYSGEVTVKSKYLNPDNQGFLRSAPGDLLGLNVEEEYQQLASFGMYLIELYDNSGEKLAIPEGSSATISFPIADKHVNNIDSEIPLWYFDEETGVWIEDGVARVEEGMMVAEVSHFSWWNCDLPYDFTSVCLTFSARDGISMSSLEVDFSIDGVNFGLATTGTDGKIIAKIPVGFSIELLYYIDGVKIGSQTVGPFEKGEPKRIINTGLDLIQISGKAIDCDGNELSNGYAYYSKPNGIFPVLLTSSGQFWYYALGVEHYLKIIDLNTNKLTEIEILEAQQQTHLVLGVVDVCEDVNSAKVSGYVFADSDGDNIGDTPVGNYDINVNYLSEFKTVKTDQNGYYETSVLPEIQHYITASNPNFVTIAAGDESPNGNAEEELLTIGNFDTKITVPQGEHDRNNNFVIISAGNGTISGSALGDSNNDGIGDIPLEWMTFAFQRNSILETIDQNAIVQDDGSFSFASEAGYKELVPDPFFFETDFILDWDTSTDSDGDDSALGANGRIPIILRDGESDENNEFVINISNRFNLLCRVLEDTDFDNVGDTPLSNLKINIKKRNTDDVIKSTVTNVRGMIDYIDFGTSSKVELTLEIDNNEYEIINIIDASPDDDPLIIGGDLTKMEIDLDRGEWDAGNTFIVRKI